MKAILGLLVSLSLISIGQVSSTAVELTDEQVLQFVKNLNDCYDVDGNKSLDEKEMIGLVRGTLVGHTKCPAKSSAVDSQLLNSTHIQQLGNFLGKQNFTLKMLYSSNSTKCDFKALHAGVGANSDILLVAKSPKGYLFGGYRKLDCPVKDSINEYWTSKGDRDAFVYSLTANVLYKSKESQVHCCSFSCVGNTNWDGLFYWNNAIHAKADNQGQCKVDYIKDANYQNTMPGPSFHGEAVDDSILVQIEVFQVKFN